MLGAIKRRWKSNKKCGDKEKVELPLPSLFPPVVVPHPHQGLGHGSRSRIIHNKGGGPHPAQGQPPSSALVDFIHVNSGRIELLPPSPEHEEDNGGKEARGRRLFKGYPSHLHGVVVDKNRHSWCGPQQMGVPVSESVQGKPPKTDKSSSAGVQCQEEHLRLLGRLKELEGMAKGLPALTPLVTQLKDDLSQSLNRQQVLAKDIDTLHLRVNTLESHNKALANIILPTLMRLTKEKATSPTPPPLSPSLCSHDKTSQTPTPTLMLTPTSTSKSIKSTKSISSPKSTNTNTKILDKTTKILERTSKVLEKTSKSLEKSQEKAQKETKTSSSSLVKVLGGTGCTTHPPKTVSSAKLIPRPTPPPSSSSRLKSKLPVRKTTSNNKNSVLSPKALVSVAGTKVPVKGEEAVPPFPPKDEGYSTMSNGAIDAVPLSLELSGATIIANCGATFTRPKKSSASSTTSTSTNSGTWTKPKNPKDKDAKDETATSPKKSPSQKKPEILIKSPNSSLKSKSSRKSPDSKSSTSRTFATATTTAQQPFDITRTAENVRIIRGAPAQISFTLEEGCSSKKEMTPILWEDSDDSDILFLPLELSSSPSGSEGTLVPYPYSRSTPTSASTRSRSSYTTTSTMTSSNSTTPTNTLNINGKRGGKTSKKGGNPSEIAEKSENFWESGDEQDLVRRWMRLEEFRTFGGGPDEEGEEEEQEQWSWDWDGILREGQRQGQQSSRRLMNNEETSSIDSNTWTRQKKPNSRVTRDSKDDKPVTNTNTLSLCLSEEDSHSELKNTEALGIDFTADFYKLTSPGFLGGLLGVEDKIIQTEAGTSPLPSDTDLDHRNSGEGDIFLQCKNCLEKMSKLISLQEKQNQMGGTLEGIGSLEKPTSYSEQVSQILLMQMSPTGTKEKKIVKEGSGTKWRPIPKGGSGRKDFVLSSSTESDEGLLNLSLGKPTMK